MNNKVSFVKCKNYEFPQLFDAVRSSIDLIGGINTFIKPNEKILLKPNLISAREPQKAVTTNPQIVRALIRIVKQAGAIPILGDSPGGAVKGVERVWEKTEMKKVAQQENIELVNFETSGSKQIKINHKTIGSIFISKAVLEADGIINLPKLKTHNLTIFTGAVKNLYGCIPGLRKGEYHKLAPHPDEFGDLISEIYFVLKDKIRLNVMDGVVGMDGNGPNTGDLRNLDIISSCIDAAKLDFALVKSLGYKNPLNIETLKSISRKEARVFDNIDFIGENVKNFNVKKFNFPKNWYVKLVPHFLINFIGKYVWLKPKIIPEICTNCLMCVNSCPVGAIIKTGSDKPRVIKDKCISCLCCHELCNFKAIELQRSLLSRMLIRR